MNLEKEILKTAKAHIDFAQGRFDEVTKPIECFRCGEWTLPGEGEERCIPNGPDDYDREFWCFECLGRKHQDLIDLEAKEGSDKHE